MRLPLSGIAEVKVLVPRGRLANELQFTLSDGPEGVSVERVAPLKDGVTVVLRSGKVKAGIRGNLILEAFVERAKKKQVLGTIPAIPFEVVGR